MYSTYRASAYFLLWTSFSLSAHAARAEGTAVWYGVSGVTPPRSVELKKKRKKEEVMGDGDLRVKMFLSFSSCSV